MIPPTRVLEAAGRALPSLTPGSSALPLDQVWRELRRRGTPAALAHDVVQLLDSVGLVVCDYRRANLSVTDDGRRVAARLRIGDWGPFAEALCTLEDVRRRLVSSSLELEQRGDRLLVNIRQARRRVPELAVILDWLPSPEGEFELAILPAEWLESMILIDQSEAPRDWVVRNEAVGLRAERYSLYLARSLNPSARVLWIAAETDRLGYDIELQAEGVVTAIEVKASTSKAVRFFLSDTEWSTAARLGDAYVVQFWGGVDLGAPAQNDYQRLRAEGYPIEFKNPIASIDQGSLISKPVNWEIMSNPLDGTNET